MTRTALDLNRTSAEALNLDPLAVNGGHVIIGESPYRYEWNPADNEAQNAMCLDWLIANVQAVQFDSGEMTVSVPMRWNKHYPCRTPAERRLAVLQAVADVEAAKCAE